MLYSINTTTKDLSGWRSKSLDELKPSGEFPWNTPETVNYCQVKKIKRRYMYQMA